jgi:hypothetical protein
LKEKRFSRLIGVTKPVIRRLARKAGLKRLNQVRYEDSQPTEEAVVIETILQSRIHHGRQEFLIKWEGISSKEATWEKASELCCPGLVEAFKNNFKTVPKVVQQPSLRRSRRMGRSQL